MSVLSSLSPFVTAAYGAATAGLAWQTVRVSLPGEQPSEAIAVFLLTALAGFLWFLAAVRYAIDGRVEPDGSLRLVAANGIHHLRPGPFVGRQWRSAPRSPVVVADGEGSAALLGWRLAARLPIRLVTTVDDDERLAHAARRANRSMHLVVSVITTAGLALQLYA